MRSPDPRLVDRPLAYLDFGPQIFIHEGARQSLERRFEAAFQRPVQLAVTDNTRRMVTHTLAEGVLRLRLHMMFLGAPEPVLEALVKYVLEDDRQASHVISGFIDQNSHRIRATRKVTGPLHTKGKRHDLLAILGDVSERYFASSVSEVLITWGRQQPPRGGKARKTIKLGSYSAPERMIRVHRSLDADWVPRYFVEYIVFHELLHHVIPACRQGGRAVLHSAEFRRREAEFRHYERAIAWEQRHIDRLLKAT